MQLNFNELPKNGIMKFRDFSKFVGFASLTTLQKRLKERTFPQPKLISGNIRYWSARDIHAYIDGKTDWTEPAEFTGRKGTGRK